MKQYRTNYPMLSLMLNDRKLTRRQFIASASALGLSLTSASALWSTTVGATPKSGGHLKAGIGGANASDTLNPATFNDTFMISVAYSIRDNLTTVAGDNTVQGAVAESWEPNATATRWVFKLRDGVEFSNGKVVEPKDVIASINLHRGKDSTSGAKGLLGGIEKIVADGKDKVVFELNSGNADFPYLMTDYHLNILPVTKNGAIEPDTTVGTGAYLLEEFEPGIRAVLKRNPNRWDQSVGFVESAELIAINDASARQTALMTGQVHVISKPDLKTLKLMERKEQVRVVDVPGRIWHAAVMHINKPPFDNNHFRLALKYGINREQYLDKILNGYGTLGNDHPISPAMRYHAEDIPQRSYDPERAKMHLNKAGYDGGSIDLHAANVFPGGVNAAVLYKEHTKRAGIDINVVQEPTDGYWSDVWNVLPFTMVWWGPRITEDLILSLAYLSDSNWNDTRIKNERLDSLIDHARSELDEKKRVEMYREIQLIIRDEGGHVVPAFANLVQVVSDKVGVPKDGEGNWKIAGSWELDGGHFVKRWWLT